jgi:hypothetical protein
VATTGVTGEVVVAVPVWMPVRSATAAAEDIAIAAIRSGRRWRPVVVFDDLISSIKVSSSRGQPGIRGILSRVW